MTKVLIWLTEGTWQACIGAASAVEAAEVTLLHVIDSDIEEVMHGVYGGLLSRRGHDPARDLHAMTTPAERALLEDAKTLLGKHCETVVRRGRIEHEVVAACIDADAELLICARDGKHDHPGPRSLGHHTRFVVDHAPCSVLLVWP